MGVIRFDEFRWDLHGIAEESPSLDSVTAKMDTLIRRRRRRNLTVVTAGVVVVLCAGPLLVSAISGHPDTTAAAPAGTSSPASVSSVDEELPRSGMCYSRVAVNSDKESFVIATKVGVPESKQRLSADDFLQVCGQYWSGSKFVGESGPVPSESPEESRRGLAACWLTDKVIGVFPRPPKGGVDDPCRVLGMPSLASQ